MEDPKSMVWWLTSGCWKVFYAYDNLQHLDQTFCLGQRKERVDGMSLFSMRRTAESRGLGAYVSLFHLDTWVLPVGCGCVCFWGLFAFFGDS